MAKTSPLRFSPLFLGLLCVLIISMNSEGVSAVVRCSTGDLDYSISGSGPQDICDNQCRRNFGGYTIISHDVEFFVFKANTCACCYEDGA
ncbi:hypothetical protein MKW94_000081 [Papaver nudicaule]|uniref:Uncharacterized protein n=1 Tax=Papaver nudicaule TaxID=74823 RepID=A0AA41V540_PAPNU|nr:hypothetical protein [Papaver nudicaule]